MILYPMGHDITNASLILIQIFSMTHLRFKPLSPFHHPLSAPYFHIEIMLIHACVSNNFYLGDKFQNSLDIFQNFLEIVRSQYRKMDAPGN